MEQIDWKTKTDIFGYMMRDINKQLYQLLVIVAALTAFTIVGFTLLLFTLNQQCSL